MMCMMSVGTNRSNDVAWKIGSHEQAEYEEFDRM